MRRKTVVIVVSFAPTCTQKGSIAVNVPSRTILRRRSKSVIAATGSTAAVELTLRRAIAETLGGDAAGLPPMCCRRSTSVFRRYRAVLALLGQYDPTLLTSSICIMTRHCFHSQARAGPHVSPPNQARGHPTGRIHRVAKLGITSSKGGCLASIGIGLGSNSRLDRNVLRSTADRSHRRVFDSYDWWLRQPYDRF